MDKFNADNRYIYYCGQESLRTNGVSLSQQKNTKCSTWVQSQNDRMVSVHFQGKPFSIMVIQAHAPTSNAEEAKFEWFYEDPQDLLELTRPAPQKRCPFHHRGLECKRRKSRDTWSNRQIWPWSTKQSTSKANTALPREHTGHIKHPLPTTQEKTLHMDITRWSTLKSD